MKKHILTILALLWCIHSWAQEDNSRLLLQSPDGKSVKLIWFFKKWSPEITGFDIKRKSGREDWTKLNSAPILPEISVQDNFSTVQPDIAAATKLKAKLTKLVGDNKLHEVTNGNYLQKLNTDTNAIKSVALMIALDYDIALINGFAYIDQSISGKGNYEYGLFIQGTDKMLAQASWKYGDKPDLDIVKDIAIKQTARKNKLQLTWKADKEQIKSLYIAGFNIYRGDKQLNQSPIMASSNNDMTAFSYFDSLAVNEAQVSYAIKAVSIFGISGDGQTIKYNAASMPDEYTSATVDTVITEGEVLKNGIVIKWKFPRNQEKYIKGFYVEKDNMPQGYRKVSELLPPDTREFADKTPTILAAYVKMHVNILYADNDTVAGNEKLFYYSPAIAPPKPAHLTAKYEITPDKKCLVKLTWDKAQANDSITSFYQLYVSDPLSGKMFLEAGIPPIKDNSYSYKLDFARSARYAFCVTAMGKTLTESAWSDTAVVTSPSLELPIPTIASVQQDSNMVIIKWQYPDVGDLKSFRVFQNNNMVVSEFEYGKNFRQFKTPALKWNANYNFTIQAVSEGGVVSLVSSPASITIYKKPIE